MYYKKENRVNQNERPDLPTEELNRRAEIERDSRHERVTRLRVMVDGLFPGEENLRLREKINASFDVPQYGDYHNEGIFMDTHLALILDNLQALRQGEVPDNISEDVGNLLKNNRDQKARHFGAVCFSS